MSQVLQSPSTTRSTTEVLLRARGVGKTFRMGDTPVEVLKGLDVAIHKGEFVAIEGRSGSGKSTLLHILGGLDSVDSGSVEFNGNDYTRLNYATGRAPWLRRLSVWLLRGWVATLIAAIVCLVIALIFEPDPENVPLWWERLLRTCIWLLFGAGGLLVGWLIVLLVRAVLHYRVESPLTRLRNEQFGFVFQFYHLLPELNVVENTMLGPMIEHSWFGFNAKRREINARAVEVLTQLGLEYRLKHRPNQLSGGERQRVAIARALMNTPRVLFADEPTGNLDAETGLQIMGVLEKLHQERGQTIVMVTHDRQIARMADRVLVLKDGRLSAPLPVEKLAG